MKKKTSLKDIANRLGISTASVSYVLSKGKGGRISKEMADKIRNVAKELDYQPNQIAKSLKSGRTYTIGLVVADISNPFFAQIARIIEDEAAKLGYTMVFGSSDEKNKKSWSFIKFLISRQVDGFIIVPAEGSEDQVEYLNNQNIPFVLMDRYFPSIPSNYVGIDNHKAAYQAVERLIETGNKKIGIFAYSKNLTHMRGRVKGSIAAMRDNGLEFNEKWLKEIDFWNIEYEVKNGIEELLMGENPIDGVFFTSNTLAVHGIRHIDKLGFKVPSNLAVVSFDHGEAFDFYYCPITYIQQPLSELGRNAVKILVEKISNYETGIRQINLEAKLNIRESCGNVDQKV